MSQRNTEILYLALSCSSGGNTYSWDENKEGSSHSAKAYSKLPFHHHGNTTSPWKPGGSFYPQPLPGSASQSESQLLGKRKNLRQSCPSSQAHFRPEPHPLCFLKCQVVGRVSSIVFSSDSPDYHPLDRGVLSTSSQMSAAVTPF